MASQPGLGKPEILACVLFVLDEKGLKTQEFDLLKYNPSLSVIQSLNSNHITATVEFTESEGTLTRYNKIGIQGQEFLILHFKTPEKKEVRLEMFVHHIDGIDFSQQNQTSLLTMHCVTKESLISTIGSVNRAFTNLEYGQTAASIYLNDIVSNGVYKNYFGDKVYSPFVSFNVRPFDVHPTDGMQDFIIPGLQPDDAIEFCARRALGKGTPMNLFLYYETFDGYCFHNIERLIKEGISKVKENGLVFSYKPTEDMTDPVDPLRKVENIGGVNLADTLERTASGAFKNKVRTINLINQNFTDIHYNYRTEDRAATLGETFLVDKEWQKIFQTNDNYETLLLKDNSRYNQFFEYIQGHRMGYTQQLTSMTCSITILGDTDLMPGQVVDFSIPEMAGTSGIERIEPTKFSGNWLVSDVINSFDTENHQTSLSLIKDKTVSTEGFPNG
tara:strand:- start:26348 stop:27682 length:1335 start_codon:yes stop_codon:yes gene_type:complete